MKFYRCKACESGYFSLDPSVASCSECLENAECPGGRVITVEPGYWRSSFYSTNILACLYDKACIGGAY